jgi:hypothetical protein
MFTLSGLRALLAVGVAAAALEYGPSARTANLDIAGRARLTLWQVRNSDVAMIREHWQ